MQSIAMQGIAMQGIVMHSITMYLAMIWIAKYIGVHNTIKNDMRSAMIHSIMEPFRVRRIGTILKQNMYIVHWIVYIVQYVVHCTIYTLLEHFTYCSTLYTEQCTLYTVQYTVHCTHVRYTVPMYTVYNVHSTVHCTMYNILVKCLYIFYKIILYNI